MSRSSARSDIPSRVSSWEPVLRGADAERALALARRLADQIRWSPPGSDASLAGGTAGLAVMFAFLARALGEPRYEASAERYLALAADLGLAGRVPDLSFFSGLAGIAWSVETTGRLLGHGGEELSDVDELLLAALERPRPAPRGLADGLVGVGVYALERESSTPALLARVLDLLVDEAYPFGLGDPGMAHGLAGTVSFAAIARGSDGASRLLSEATGALLAHELPPGRGHAFAAAHPARWCDGDAGIAAALSRAGALVAHPSVLPAAAHAMRSVPGEPGGEALDALGLGSGVAGVAHVLHVLGLSSGCGQTLDAAGAWSRALMARVDAGGHSGRSGFLDGTAGVVLALVAASTDTAPTWNRALLLA